jgi:hypothetical protein
VIGCVFILPFGKGIIAVRQKQFSFGFVVPVHPAQNHIEREFPLSQFLENVLTKIRCRVVVAARAAETHLLDRRWNGCAEEDLMAQRNQVNM